MKSNSSLPGIMNKKVRPSRIQFSCSAPVGFPELSLGFHFRWKSGQLITKRNPTQSRSSADSPTLKMESPGVKERKQRAPRIELDWTRDGELLSRRSSNSAATKSQTEKCSRRKKCNFTSDGRAIEFARKYVQIQARLVHQRYIFQQTGAKCVIVNTSFSFFSLRFSAGKNIEDYLKHAQFL